MKDIKNCDDFRKLVLHQVDEGSSSDDEDDDFILMGEASTQEWDKIGRYRAVSIIKETTPFPDETVTLYAKRLETSLNALKEEFHQDTEDEDGFRVAAVMDYINTIQTFSR